MRRALILIVALLLTVPVWATPVDKLQKVGSARLKVLFWTIYDSTLYSDDGQFDGIEPHIALQITYRRSINSPDLIRRTAEEWQKRNVAPTLQQTWLAQLRNLWPDVRAGDTLTLYVDEELYSRFYFNGRFIGSLDDSGFTHRFLAIWLDENSDYPEQRANLTAAAD